MKNYNELLYKAKIEENVLVGNLTAEDIHAQHVLKAGDNCEIVDGGTKEEPDPTRPIINAVGISYPLEVDNKCESVDDNATLEIDDDKE
ncbi:MAG: hypothetical protein LBS38_00330, partial [Endomicrobium sp.]|nr:hypothetical protein [Endomicrobium sp.]